MNDIKKKLLEEIDRKVARRKAAKERALYNNTINAFVQSFMNNIDDINTVASNEVEWQFAAETALNSLTQQIRSYDSRARVDVSWFGQEGEKPRVNGVTIKWSPEYQRIQSCDPELFIDVTTLMFD